MPNFKRFLLLLLCIGSVFGTGVRAQELPLDKPVRLVVPYPPGSGTDTLARYTARRLKDAMGANFIVENRTGANAVIGAKAVTSAAPDGTTLLWAANGPVTTNVALYEKLSYDPLTELEPVARLAYSPLALYVSANSPYKTAGDLFDAIRQRPGVLSYGSGSSTYSIGMAWLLSLVQGKATEVQYRGAAPALLDLGGGQIDFALAEYSAGLSLTKGGKIRVLALTSDQRLASEPGIPTIQELGYKDFFTVAWWGVFAPKGTPKPIILALEKALMAIYSDGETKKYLDVNNYAKFLASAEQLRDFQRKEIAREVRLVEDFKIPKL